nr:hypothetical protein [Tanacetum cinerariifolium]
MAAAEVENRVLILAPRGRDAVIAADLLRRDGIEAVVYDALAPMVTALDDGAGAVMITE